MISAIGFRPVIAAPMAAPRIACSEIGQSRTRLRAELLVEPDRGLEHAARLGDVLAEEDHVGIARHLLRDAARHRIAIGQFRHAKPPSA